MKWYKVEDGLPYRKGLFISVDMRDGAKSLRWHTLNSPWSLGEGPITHWAEIELPGEDEHPTRDEIMRGVPSEMKTATQIQQEMRANVTGVHENRKRIEQLEARCDGLKSNITNTSEFANVVANVVYGTGKGGFPLATKEELATLRARLEELEDEDEVDNGNESALT